MEFLWSCQQWKEINPLTTQVNIPFSLSHSYLGLPVDIDCGSLVGEAAVIQCNFEIYWERIVIPPNGFFSWQQVAWLEFRTPPLSIIQVFRHPAVVDRWIIIFPWQNNWNDSGFNKLGRVKGDAEFQQEMCCQHLCALRVRKWKKSCFLSFLGGIRFPDCPNMRRAGLVLMNVRNRSYIFSYPQSCWETRKTLT